MGRGRGNKRGSE
jgi:hypothetical protein